MLPKLTLGRALSHPKQEASCICVNNVGPWNAVMHLGYTVPTSPATENTRSAGVDVAVMARYFLASLANKGNLCSLTFHHSRGDRGYCSCLK